MISFDDLVNVGGDTEQLENEMREIRLNTQVNRFSIIDCTNSIESLSSMISTITVADYSASLSSLSSDTLALYNSLTTITGGGGGGFGYLEPYSAHSTESFIYNCNDVLSNQSFNETFKEVGPNINFDNVSFTTDQKLSLKGQTFNSCLIQSNTEPMMLDYKLIQNNNLYNNSLMNIKADEFKNNVITNSSTSILFPHYNITALTDSGNQYSEISYLYMSNNNISDNTFISVNRNYITADIISSNMFSSHRYGNMIARSFIYNTMSYNCINNVLLMEHIHSNLFSINIGLYLDAGNAKKNTYTSNTYLKGCIRYCSGNLYDSIFMLSLTGTSHSLNTFNSITSMNLVNVYFKQNLLNNNSFINLSGYSLKSNTITTNSFININGYYVETNVLNSNSLINIDGYRIVSNSAWGQFLLNTVNGYILYNNQISGRVGKICHDQGSGNSFQPSILDYTGFSITSNTIGAYQNGHVKIGFAKGDYIGSVDNGGLLTLEVFSAEKINVGSVRGFCDIKAGNLYSCTIYYDTVCGVSVKNISSCEINNNPICNIDVWSSFIYNTLSSCNYAKIDGLTNINFDRNTFNDIETLKICIDNTKQFINKFSNISELHLKNANIFDSTKSNKFSNISSYFFKYTDGLYNGTDINSDLTSISNSAYIKYVPCSWLNVGGGGGSGGFDYWEGYVNHSQNGYNVSGTVKSALIANNIYSLGPYANFSNCTFQSVYEVHSLNCEKFHTNSFFSNQTEINIKASEFIENTFMNCRMVNVSACTFTGNSYIANGVVNISANDMKLINYIKNNDVANITCYNTDIINLNKPVISGNNYANIMGDNLWSGSMIDNKFINVNCKTIKYFSISNTFNNITAYYIGNNTIAYHNTNINCIFNFSCSNFNDNSVQVRTNSFNLSALYMADNTFSNCSYLTINAGNISRLQLYSDSQAISTNRVLKLKGNSIDSCNVMDYERVYLDCPIMKNIFLYDCPSIYLTTTYDFLKSFVYTSDYSNFNYSDKFIYNAFCTHFDFNDIDLVLDRFGGYSLTQIDKSKCYINGIPLIKLYPDA